jgi:formate dehydrogenase subunit gamma
VSAVVRFTPSERAFHWVFAAGWLVLFASGLPLMSPGLQGWIRGYSPVVGRRLHLAAAVVWIAAIAAVLVVGNRGRLAATWRELATLDADDRRWLARLPRWLAAAPVARARLDADVGRFNAGQKLNALFTTLSSALLLASGLTLVPEALGSGVLGPPAAVLRVVHRWTTLVALLPVGGHLFFAVVFPATRPSLPGMLRGRVSAEWAARHHPRWRGERAPEDRAA